MIYRRLLLACLVPPFLAMAGPAPAPSLDAAVALYTARRDAEAQTALDALRKAAPDDPRVLDYLARLARRRNDWPAVSELYEQCTRLAPDSAAYWAALGEARGSLARRAGIFERIGLAHQCRDALEKAVALAPDNLTYRDGLVHFYLDAPAVAGGGADKALAQAAEIARRDAFACAMATGSIRQDEEQWEEAEQSFREAARLKPDELLPVLALGRLAIERGRYDDAFAQFAAVLAKQPDNPAALFETGRTAALSGRQLDRGEAGLRQYLAQPQRSSNLPTHAQAHLQLGRLLVRKGDPASARAEFTEALRLDPGLKEAAGALAALPK